MRAHWRSFLCALQFLTLVPVRLPGVPDAATQARAVLYYPLVGLVLGASFAGLATLSQGLPDGVQAALVLLLWCALTGGLHLDGLADSADGWMGGLGERERTLRIMKDPHIGATGALALMLQLLLKWSLLQALLAGNSLWPLLLAPVVGRSAAQWLLLTTDYARPGGIASGLRQIPHQPVWLTAAVLAWVLLGLHPLMLLLPLLLFWWLRRLMLARLQGYTGDTAGALIELTEVALLAAGLALMSPA
ncbi:adenosylcobinamide-GDP ribazoletransferase [Marinobacterium sediminicola]|uniref:Adenosylcobinamide-GDP ribazoletransferase n=1 Tax=Marinobacterium sediminicola TaxID=518898 RepID=A0ABY1S1P9_9GAMM|nr:adenosylcobinamide-GDP ribazoletransferase [Marinobacterium sediminicola]ULG69433.1 adenosylcobinamide-GDP ribazoletransferase [Marinobacterium sediminicola]SMR75583.1 cobalamin-5'-phosphate synthase [Marinobacterium sediminicola]